MPDIHEFEELMSESDSSSNRLHGRTRILRASEVLLSLAGQIQDHGQGQAQDQVHGHGHKDTPTGVETYQDVLRVVPAEGGDVRCPDCPAVFSSPCVPIAKLVLCWLDEKEREANEIDLIWKDTI